MIPGFQLGEFNGHALVDSEGLTILISFCCMECLNSVGWPSLSLKNEQKKTKQEHSCVNVLLAAFMRVPFVASSDTKMKLPRSKQHRMNLKVFLFAQIYHPAISLGCPG